MPAQLKHIRLFEDFNEGRELNLSNIESIRAWMMQNAPEQIFDENGSGDINWDYTDPMSGEDLATLISTYQERYDEVTSKPKIEIYRALRLNNIDDLNINHVGVFWSFNEDGVGIYGDASKHKDGRMFILNAQVNTSDIDWEQGFYSFLAYGPAEFECYMNKNARCTITHIDGNKLDEPMSGRC